LWQLSAPQQQSAVQNREDFVFFAQTPIFWWGKIYAEMKIIHLHFGLSFIRGSFSAALFREVESDMTPSTHTPYISH